MNSISKYLLDKIHERRPGDSMYALSKRTGINTSVLATVFKAPKAWSQCVNLHRICNDIGISMEEAVLQKKISSEEKYGKLMKLYNEKCIELEVSNDKIKKLQNAIKELTK